MRLVKSARRPGLKCGELALPYAGRNPALGEQFVWVTLYGAGADEHPGAHGGVWKAGLGPGWAPAVAVPIYSST
jgi:hypothetical protein